MKIKKIYILLTIIVMIFLSQTIIYAALSSTVKITGNAYARVEKDVRITNFKLASVTNATSSFEEYSATTLATEIDLKDTSSSITYFLEITNYGSADVGIYSITGLPSNVNYSIKDYNLKDKICDDTGKCNSFVTKTYEITFTTQASYKGTIQLTFDFQNFYSISYKNLNNPSYPKEIISGDDLVIDISTSIMNKYYANNQNGTVTPVISNDMLTISNVTSDINIIGEQENSYVYTGDYQTYTTPAKALYKIELWGAGQTGNSGKGGYTKGEILLDKGINLYLYLGGSGISTEVAGGCEGTGGWNGGGDADNSQYQSGKRLGGNGATDVRLISGEWNDFESLKTRIMVAGAGGAYSQSAGGAGGGLKGYDGTMVFDSTTETYKTLPAPGGTQTAGGEGSYCPTYKGSAESGTFGKGGNGYSYGAGAGGGYFGGAGGPRSTSDTGSGGGSSFISGHNGCVAIAEESTSDNIIQKSDSEGNVCTDGTEDIICSYHYSGYIFENTAMIDGKGYNWTTEVGTTVVKMPSPTNASTTIVGNTTHGYAKITLIELK